MKLMVHTDGASRNNPGKGACAFIIESTDSVITRQKCGKYLGVVTNNEAEYEAIIEALRWVLNQTKIADIEEITIKSDSLLLVSQLTGKWKIKDRELQQKARIVKELERELGVPVRYMHIPRELNREADTEVNQILDRE